MKTKLESDTGSNPPACSRLTEREGYKAFEKSTREMLDRAQNAKPRRPRKGYKNRAEYRAGYYDGILAVWCMMALVEHPRHPVNAEQIRRILSSENADVEATPPEPQ
jgi:hypothetical protein